MGRRVVAGTVCLLAVALGLGAGRAVLRSARRGLPLIEVCADRSGFYAASDPLGRAGYFACIDAKAKTFLDRDYAEAKDASKAFLTLLTAVFVASITFSEKIVDIPRSSAWSRGLMIACWVLLLLAIAACGTGLALMMVAAGQAAYEPQYSYWSLENAAVYLYISSGLAFGLALVALLGGGILSLAERPRSDVARG
jgi:hypothetical protein